MVENAVRDPSADYGTDTTIHGRRKRSKAAILLLVLSIEKTLQHLFVTYAFAVDLGGIRDSVVIHHAPLMIVGFVVGLLFAGSTSLQFKNQRSGYWLLLYLALFDFIAEFVAQGTLAIEIVVSIVVATIILLTLFLNRQTLLKA
ncbi:MAG: hypothetical protein ACR2PK_10145 [Acidimicrobiales bacterium]